MASGAIQSGVRLSVPHRLIDLMIDTHEKQADNKVRERILHQCQKQTHFDVDW